MLHVVENTAVTRSLQFTLLCTAFKFLLVLHCNYVSIFTVSETFNVKKLCVLEICVKNNRM